MDAHYEVFIRLHSFFFSSVIAQSEHSSNYTSIVFYKFLRSSIHNLYFQISKSHINYWGNFQVCASNFQIYTSDSLGSYSFHQWETPRETHNLDNIIYESLRAKTHLLGPKAKSSKRSEKNFQPQKKN